MNRNLILSDIYHITTERTQGYHFYPLFPYMSFNIICGHLKCFLDVISGLGFEEAKARHGYSLCVHHGSLLLLTARVSDTDCDYPAPCSRHTGPGAS